MADLPLESIAWHVEVTGPLADLTVDQTFHNASDHAVDATYVFPLDADAAVDRMRIEVGGRVIEGEIHTRADADRMYAEAAAAGRPVQDAGAA